MTVQLNHTIVHARDAEGSAAFLSEMLGVGPPRSFGPFVIVDVDNGVSLDFMTTGPEWDITIEHYTFLVSEPEFDEIFGRIQDRDLPYWADPHGDEPGEINHHDGGRGVYWHDPDGHMLEIITVPYDGWPAATFPRWSPGDVVVRREVWRGRPWLANPLYVVEDTDDALVLYQPEGSPFGFGAGDDWPTATGRHPYDGRTAWVGEGPLGLHRPTDPYAVWAYWRGLGRAFSGWYVNIQSPIRRTEIGIDSLDLELDLVVSPAYDVAVKDEEHVAASAVLGRFSDDTAAGIHAVGARIKAEIEAGERWWDERWSRWVPPADLLRPPPLAAGWQDVPAEHVGDLLATAASG